MNERDACMVANALAERREAHRKRRRYRYATLPVHVVLGLTAGLTKQRDAFVSDDAEARAFHDLQAKGYRWVRTDGEFAVFELTC